MAASHRARRGRSFARGLSVGAAPVVLAAAFWAGACGRGQPPASAARVDAPRTASAAPPLTGAGTSSGPLVSPPSPAKTTGSPRVSAPVPAPPPAPASPVPVSASAVASLKTDPAAARCPSRPRGLTKDVLTEVSALAKACEGQTKRTLVGRTFSGRQADQDKPQSVAFQAKADRCYRAYARATDGIKSLDLAIKDSFGYVAAEETSEDSSAIVPEAGTVCFSRDDKASVVVSVGMGNGSYALEIWSD